MSLDMYSDKVAEASALIREFAKVDYFHYFARDPESSLEAFIAMLDQAEEKGRQSQAARIAEMELQIVEVQAECIKRGADLLERQLAEASAPAVGQQPVKPWEDRMQEYFAQGSVRMRTPAYFMADEIFDWRKTSPAAPQAADTDKVREALKLAIRQNSHDMLMTGEEIRQCEAALHSMAAQAPVREVPEGWRLVPIEPTQEMLKAIVGGADSPGSFLVAAMHYREMLAVAPEGNKP